MMETQQATSRDWQESGIIFTSFVQGGLESVCVGSAPAEVIFLSELVNPFALNRLNNDRERKIIDLESWDKLSDEALNMFEFGL